MGRKERRDRENKRESYASRQSTVKRKNMLIAIGVFSIIAVIVGYSVYVFLNMTETAPGGPENAGALGSAHDHAGVLVNIFGDSFDFSAPSYQIKSSWIHFEARDAFTIHKHATGVTLGYLFDTLQLTLDDQCFIFKDGRQFCTNDDYVLQFYINGEQVSDIREYEIADDDRILIAYGSETPEEIDAMLLELESKELLK
ncbi:MAG: protein-disulfide isomerase [Nitrosopumilus sp.]|jgi:hypothetical protein